MALSEKAKNGLVNRTRPGTEHSEGLRPAIVRTEDHFDGLELTDLQYRPISWFKPDPENDADFSNLKNRTPSYWEDLRRDIEAVGITTPLLATPDGRLLYGHSRLKIAGEMEAEGKKLNVDKDGLARLPVRLVLSPLSQSDFRHRRRLDNLLRFDIDPNTRLAFLTDIWPEFYTSQGQKGAPTSIAETSSKTTGDIAKATGDSPAKVKKDRQITVLATQIAKEEGLEIPEVRHIQQARDKINNERRLKDGDKKEPKNESPTNSEETARPAVEILFTKVIGKILVGNEDVQRSIYRAKLEGIRMVAVEMSVSGYKIGNTIENVNRAISDAK